MATSMFIKPESFNHLTESQVCEWRQFTYNNLNNKTIFTLQDLQQFAITTPPSIDELMSEIDDKIKEFKILGKLTHTESTFLYIDSSTMCRMTIPTMIKKTLIKYPQFTNTNIIIIFSEISKAENLYKFINKYPDVNYKHLEFNLDLLFKKIKFTMKNVMILNTNIYLDNKILFNEEKNYLNKYHNWKAVNIKNEINDDAQIILMEIISNYFQSFNSIILSHDKKMCSKINFIKKSIKNLFSMEYNDFK